MSLISVLMPVYNRETMVADAIRSIQDQTFHDWQLIILDDASTDKTLEVCRAFEAEDKRIRVLSNERNIGVGESRNRLLSFASSKYIAIHDSDDVSIPERLALEVEVLESKPEIGLVSGITAWIDVDDGRILWYYPVILHRGEQYPQDRGEMVRLLYTGCEVANAACMFRHSLIEEIPNPYGKYHYVDDWYFLLQVAHRTLIWGIPGVLVKMSRGKNHTHLCQGFAESTEAQRLSRDVYRHYKDDPQSPINYRLYRKSISTHLTSKGRYLGNWKGLLHLLQAILWDPYNRRARESVREFSSGVFRKGMDRGDDYSKWLQS